MPKYRRVHELLLERRLLGGFGCCTPPLASRELLLMGHRSDYVSAVLERRLDAAAMRRLGLPLDESIVRRALAAVGGTLRTAELALADGLACNLAGGSHHAHAGFGAGFCVFNDVVVATRALLASGQVDQVLIIDLDVHQGDGTAAMLADEPRAFTFSMHARHNFPARKQHSDIDVALDDGLRDQAYLEILESQLLVLLPQLQPDLVFYNAGVDPHRDDRLGRLALSDAGLRQRDRLVIEHVRRCGASLACVLGGGYDPDPDVVAGRHLLLHEALHEA